MTKFTVTLTEEDWAKVLNALADAPFKYVAVLIQNLQEQLQPQLQQKNEQQKNEQQKNEQQISYSPGAPASNGVDTVV